VNVYLRLAGPLCPALAGLSAVFTLNPGLTPWAILLDPFGVPGSAPETSLEQNQLRCTSRSLAFVAPSKTPLSVS
jgi:hypothetical protein